MNRQRIGQTQTPAGPGAAATAIRIMDDMLAAIARDGSSASLADQMASFNERETVVDTASYLARDARYAA